MDADVCIGCGSCIPLCPYGARHADAHKAIVEKCNFCAPYVARGEQPACVATCLAECRHLGDLDDPGGELVRLIRQRGAEPLTTKEVQIGPKVYYAPADKRAQLLAHGVVRPTRSTSLTRLWQVLAMLGGGIGGVGAQLARGCTSGQAITGGGQLALGSWIFMFATFGGAYALAYVVRKQWI